METHNRNDTVETKSFVANGTCYLGNEIAAENHELQTFKADDNNTSEDATDNACFKDSIHVEPDMSVRQIWFNVIMFSLSYLLLFTAFLSYQNLQSSVNQAEGLGTVGLAVVYFSMFTTALFFPPLTMSRLSLKWTSIFSLVTYLGYMATGYYPSWFTIIPASAFVGAGAAHLWIVNSAFITQLARRYAAQTNTTVDDAVSHFFGTFFVALCSTNILGNLLSSLVLQVNLSNPANSTENSTRCGAEFCSSEKGNASNIMLPSKQQYYVFTSICIGFALAATACLVLFMKYIPPESGRGRVDIVSNLKKILALLLKDHRQHLLILPTLYRGMMQAFSAGDFTIAFVSCPLGVDKVGFVMTTFGVVGAIMSYTFGKLSKYTGLYPLFCLAFVAHTAVCITTLLWTPNSSQPHVIYILAGLWSVGDSAYLTLVSVIYSVYFEDKLETAISCFRLVDAFGIALTFGYSAFMCTRYKIYIIQAALLASHICLTVFFARIRKKRI